MNTVLQGWADSSAGSRPRPYSSQHTHPLPTRAIALDLRKVCKRNRRYVKMEKYV